ncbi:MAG TPA: hypothetical protein P5526_14755 [Anaerolineae bacterium]|nr:hypothetical protein [Anaerolineae bacterium]
MLRAIPDGWFSWDFTIFDNNTPIVNVDLAWVRESGEFNLGGSNYKVYREGFFSGVFILEKQGQALARAEKPSALFRSFKVEYESKSYKLEAETALRRKFVLRAGERRIGTLEPEHAFSRKAIINLPEDIALPVRIFMVWLTIIMWKREADLG